MTEWMTVLIGLAAFLLSAAAGWPLTSAVLSWAAHAEDAGVDGGPASGEGEEDVALPPRAVLRGGTWIGILERLAITGCLVAGYPAGIAFVVAVKGLGRYPELREHPGLSERFVIGTLASMGWAALVGAAARGLLV